MPRILAQCGFPEFGQFGILPAESLNIGGDMNGLLGTLALLAALDVLPRSVPPVQSPVARLITTPIGDVVREKSKASHGLVAGVVATPSGEEASVRPSLSVYVANSREGQRICVNVASADGGYWSGDVEYELPIVREARRVLLPYAEVSRHFGHIESRPADAVAVLARLGSCPAKPDSPVLIAGWHATVTAPKTVGIAVISGGRLATVSLGTDAGGWSSPTECEATTEGMVQFDRICRFQVAPTETELRIRIDVLNALGRRVADPVLLTVARAVAPK